MSCSRKWASLLSVTSIAVFVVFAAAGTGQADQPKTGEAEFKTYCSACHYEGGNLLKADKTLSKSDRERNGVKSAQDIIRLVRHPGEGMTVFDESMLSEKDAQAIAEYIITTYK